MPLIDLQDISYSYTVKNQKQDNEFTLDDINLKVEHGEFITVLGQNGSGKSTLLRIIGGSIIPKQGKAMLNGRELRHYSRKSIARSIAVVPQASVTIFPFSVYEIVMMGRTPYLNMWGYESAEDKKIVNEALEMVEISHLRHKGINEVSGGEAQRAYIARAIAQQPGLILLDEANSHLDIKHQISIFNLIRELNTGRKMTVIAISHDLNMAGYYSNRIILMKNGRIHMDDSVSNVLTEENILQVFGVDSRVEVLPSGRPSVNINPGKIS